MTALRLQTRPPFGAPQRNRTLSTRLPVVKTCTCWQLRAGNHRLFSPKNKFYKMILQACPVKTYSSWYAVHGKTTTKLHEVHKGANFTQRSFSTTAGSITFAGKPIAVSPSHTRCPLLHSARWAWSWNCWSTACDRQWRKSSIVAVGPWAQRKRRTIWCNAWNSSCSVPQLNTLRVTQYVHPHLQSVRGEDCVCNVFNDPTLKAAPLRLQKRNS